MQSASREALTRIGSVIKNPEIRSIAPVILRALNDPVNKTQESLTALLETAFVHVIDAPSLALIMPILRRALTDKSTTTKKMATQIIGNMYSLTEAKDLAPYIADVIPGLQASLVGPISPLWPQPTAADNTLSHYHTHYHTHTITITLTHTHYHYHTITHYHTHLPRAPSWILHPRYVG